jgi:hypothetical protein
VHGVSSPERKGETQSGEMACGGCARVCGTQRGRGEGLGEPRHRGGVAVVSLPPPSCLELRGGRRQSPWWAGPR